MIFRNNIFKILIISSALILFFIPEAQADWYNSSWGYRKKITIDSTKVSSGPHTDFPALVNLTDINLASDAQDDGDDILFTSSNETTKLSHEIEKFSGTTGELAVWVKISSLPSSANTDIYMYYGNAEAANQQDAVNVWDANYKLVQHLEETSACAVTLTDSTSNATNGTCGGTPTATSSGKIAGAWTFSTNNYVDLADLAILFFSGSFTIEAWINASGGSGTSRYIMADYVAVGNLSSFALHLTTSDKAQFFWENPGGAFPLATSTTTIATGGWYHVVGTWDGTTRTVYVNGVSEDTNATVQARADVGQNSAIGRPGSNNSLYFPGTIDEVRVSSIARSAAWITTEYNNQNSTSTFYTVGSTENKPVTALAYRGLTKIQRPTSFDNPVNPQSLKSVSGFGPEKRSTRLEFLSPWEGDIRVSLLEDKEGRGASGGGAL